MEAFGRTLEALQLTLVARGGGKGARVSATGGDGRRWEATGGDGRRWATAESCPLNKDKRAEGLELRAWSP